MDREILHIQRNNNLAKQQLQSAIAHAQQIKSYDSELPKHPTSKPGEIRIT